ncbi:HAUS augmin-like complex subunit 5 isoform X2 [Chamaea fasciata]|uniref:HAUS augmin-like complex subunit 5 isoform X2 n=1 Tax=Chamaea fasciata TaxID=190680 RepID=UPI00336A3331
MPRGGFPALSLLPSRAGFFWGGVCPHRNARKIRGNLRWYGHLRQVQAAAAAAAPPGRQGALLAARARLRQELQSLEDAIESAQDTARRLEAALGAEQRRRWAELRRGAELRLLGAGLSPERLRRHQGALKAPRKRPGQSRVELSAILASGAEPQVLVSIKALCAAREAELWRPRPPRKSREEPPQAQDWLEQAEAVLIGYSPEAVLWALEALANQSTRQLLSGPAPSPEATPTLRSLIQGCWGAVGALWGALPPLLSHLSHLRRRLGELRPRLGPEALHRLFLSRAFLGAFLASLSRDLRPLRQDPPKSPKSAQKTPKSPKSTQKIPKSPKSAQKTPNLAPKTPKSPDSVPKSPDLGPNRALGRLQRRLRRARERVLRRRQRLRFLSAAARGRRAALRPLQEQVVGVARAGLGSALPSLLEEGRRRRGLVQGALGTLGAPLPQPGPAPPPLEGLREAGLLQGASLSRAAALRQQLRRGALRLRRGAGLAREAGPPPAPPPASLPEGVAELLPRLRLVSDCCRQRIEAWPHLQGLVRQWWDQPAQFVLATPPGHAPFSHWLQRWRHAAHALQATPTEREGEEATPP